ncbi:SGNH/GDSL hydrolase family protein [Halomonas denitrificans]|nr:SGNH/GDSL hydrolase family protein [Halomonas denitrificans]
MNSFRFWMLFALALPAAIRTRRTAVRAEGAAGPVMGSIGSGPVFRLVGLGDSIIAGVGASTHARGLVGRAAEHLAEAHRRCVRWSVHGRSGATSASIRQQLMPDADLEQADAVVVSAGVNDLTRLSSPRRYGHDLGALLDAIERRAPDARIAVAGMPPLEHFPALPPSLQRAFGIRGRQFDDVIRNVAASRSRTVHVPIVVDDETAARRDAFSADGFHPSEASYVPFGRAAADALSGCFD